MKPNTERVEELRSRLRQALVLRGMKATDLSERTGIPKGAISYYLSGKSHPKADRLHTISVTLDVSEAWLMGYDVTIERVPVESAILQQLKRDPEFVNLVVALTKLPKEQYAGIKQLITSMSRGGNPNDV